MLSEADRQLITAGVCGRLPPTDKSQLRMLLADNPAALTLYKSLCRDRDRLASLPRVTAPASVLSNVLARIQSGPIIVPPKPRVHRGAGWLPFALAASLLVTAAGLYLYFSKPVGNPDIANRTPAVDPLPDPAVAAADNVTPRTPEFVGPPRPDTAVAIAPAPSRPEDAPIPRTVQGPAPFTADVVDPTVFTTIDARLPVLFPIADATAAEVIRKVKAEFAAGNALRLDLFAKDTHRAADLFATAVRAGGTQLAVDTVTQELLKRKVQFAWATYSESLGPTEVLTILKRLKDADAKPGVAPVWVSGHLTAAAATDGKEAKDLFNVDPANWKKAKPNATAAPTEPIANDTINKVTAALGKPAPGTAVMVTYLPVTARIPPANSPQIKKFHDDKPPKKDTAVPLLIVIRPAI